MSDEAYWESAYRDMHKTYRGQATEIEHLREEVRRLRWNPDTEVEDELDRLRVDNERLTAIIANVCLALGYEESAWPTHWETPPADLPSADDVKGILKTPLTAAERSEPKENEK